MATMHRRLFLVGFAPRGGLARSFVCGASLLIVLVALGGCQPRAVVSEPTPRPPPGASQTDQQAPRIPTPLSPEVSGPRTDRVTTEWWKDRGPVGAHRGAATMEQNRFYDPTNPGYRTLQKANQALQGMPIHRNGYVDWSAALNRGLIHPRASLTDKTDMVTLDRDIIMKDTRLMPYVRFPHKAHTEWLACTNCHDQIFASKTGGNPVTMAAILSGEYCGVCHNTVAFPTLACERCHNVPRGE